MGKKSKKKAAAAAAAAAAVAAGGPNAKAKCFRCFGTVKVSEGKGHQCPGCLSVYCFRCEKKEFRGCPRGDECQNLTRRCKGCRCGRRIHEGKISGIDSRTPPYGQLINFFHNDDNPYSIHACPMIACRTTETCLGECICCFLGPNSMLTHCKGCDKLECKVCAESIEELAFQRLTEEVSSVSARGGDGDLTSVEERMSEIAPNLIVDCGECGSLHCMQCSSRVSISQENFRLKISSVCLKCYWKAKPCTNPNCPNEPGVPTKRCGDCRIARYCSKECQAAAYPDHLQKCENIQNRRIVRLTKEAGLLDLD